MQSLNLVDILLRQKMRPVLAVPKQSSTQVRGALIDRGVGLTQSRTPGNVFIPLYGDVNSRAGGSND